MPGTSSHGRAHFSSAELETERGTAAVELGALIERRALLLTRIAEIEFAMRAAEAKIKAFD